MLAEPAILFCFGHLDSSFFQTLQTTVNPARALWFTKGEKTTDRSFDPPIGI